MTASYIQFALTSQEEEEAARIREEAAIARFHERQHRHRNSYAGYLGTDGQGGMDMGRGTRRQIMNALRKASRIMGPGQKSKIGRLGAGTAIGAALAAIASPASAQYSAGGGTATGTNSVAIGTGSTADGISAVAIGQNNDADSDDVNSQQIFDRVNGGAYNYPTGVAGIIPAAVAIGDDNVVTHGGVAIGDGNRISGANWSGVAIGNGNQVSGAFGVTTGFGNLASATAAIAIGTANTASGNTSIAMGRQSTASGDTSLALGNVAQATGVNAIAFGHSTQASADGTIAIGGGTNGASQNQDTTAANASATDAIAIGTSATSSGASAIAIGENADVSGLNATALGANANASGTSSLAAGNGANASGSGNVALGFAASASDKGTTAVGTNASASAGGASSFGQGASAAGANSVAIGTSAIASQQGGIAVGNASNASGVNATAISVRAAASGSGSIAIGVVANASAADAIAVGTGATASDAGSVALGNGSTTAAPNSGTFAINGGTPAGTAPASVVSIGSAGNERQITNVAAGVLSATSTNAVNGSQLFTVATASNNIGTSLETVTGGGLVIGPDGTITTPAAISVGGSSYSNTTDAIQAGDDKVDAFGANSATALGGGSTFDPNTGALTAPTITVGGIAYNDVASAVEAADAKDNTANSGIASALGGGAAIAADGTVTGPAYTIAGSTYNNVGDALNALASGGATAEYFNANSSLADSSATGIDSVAIGPETTAVGISSIASGHSADAIGNNSSAYGTNAVAGSDNSTALGANTTAGGINSTAIGNSVTANGNFATVIGMGSSASASNALAIGRTANASGLSSIAVGHDVVASAADTVAIGHSSSAVGPGSVSIGLGQTSTGRGAVAIGDPNTANGTGAVALGADNIAGGNATASTPADGAVAIGNGNNAIGQGSVAIGSTSDALAAGSIAFGDTAVANNAGDVALGSGSVTAAPNTGAFSIHGGAAAGTSPTSVISVGSAGNERQIQNVAAGVVSATSTDAVNGSQLYLTELATNNLGDALETVAGGGLAINPDGTIATPIAISVGGASYADIASAIGAEDNKVDALGADVASSLGGGSTFDMATGDITAPTYNVAGSTQNDVGAAFNALNIANDTANTGIASSIGGGASIAADGTVTAPTITVGGTAYNNVTDAVQAAGAGFNLTTGAIGTGVANGTSVEGIAAGETVTLIAGDNLVVDQATNEAAFSLADDLTGLNSITTTTLNTDALNVTGGPTIDGTGITLAAGDTFDAGGNVVTNLANGSVAAGSADAVTGDQLFAATSTSAMAVDDLANTVEAITGGGAVINADGTLATAPTYNVAGSTQNNVADAFTALDDKAMAIGMGLSDAIGGGAAMAPDGTITAPTIMVAGTAYNNATDAVEAGDAKSDEGLADVADALGGGAVYDPATGAISAPSFAIQGSTFNSAGDAFAAVDSELSALLGGTSGLVQQVGGAPGTGDITVGAATGGTTVNMAGTDGDRTVTGMLAGDLAAGSSDAVNGDQINRLGSSVAANTGGGSVFDPVTGTITAPTINVGGSAYSDVTSAIEAGDAKVDMANSGLAGAIGGGASVAPDGTVTAPSVVVAGTTYNSLSDAIAAAGGGFSLTTAAVGTGIANGSSVENIAPGDTVTLIAGDNLIATQAGGATEFALNPDLTGIDSIAVNGGPAIDGSGITLAAGNIFDAGGNVLTNLGAGTVAAGSTDAVTGDQLFAASQAAGASTDTLGQNLAANLGGTASYDPNTDMITGLAINVGGTSYGTVTEAIEAGDAKDDLANSGIADALGGGASVAADGTVTGPTYNVAGATQSNVGDAFTALDDKAMAIGMGLADALGGGATMAPDGTITAPSFAIAGTTFNNAGDAFAAVDSELAGLANGTSGLVQQAGGAPGTGDISIGAATGGTVVDVTGTDGERLLTGLLNGNLSAGSTDAVNGGQINSLASSVGNAIGGGAMFDPVTGELRDPTIIVGGQNYSTVTEAIEAGDAKADNANSGLADALGGGASVAADGTVTAPAYVVQGGTHNNVGSAIAAVDGEISNITTDIAALTNGSSGIVQQQAGGAPGSGEVTIGAATGGSSLNVAGTDGNRVVTGVADGAVASASSDAVNGSQLFAVKQTADGALQRGGGTMTGAIDMGGNAISNVAGPVNAGDATNKAYVDGLVANSAATASTMGSSTASLLGAGSSYDPATGQISVPDYIVGGQSYDNVGSAIAATNMLAVQYVADGNGQPTNAINLAQGGQPVNMSGLAAGAVNATSTDAVNGSQLHSVKQTADGALQRTGGTMSGNLNFGGNRATGLAGPVDATDAATKGYVDNLQTQNVNQFNLLTTGLNKAFDNIERNSQGVALAIAMGGGFLSDDKDFSLWGAWGSFEGYNAAAMQTYIRLNDDAFINAGISYGFEEQLVGTRVGFGIQF